MSSKKAPKNKYVKNSHLSERRFGELPRLFRAGATALSAASPTGLNRNTANRHHGMPRARIAEACGADGPFDGEVEAGESHFGARRVRGARGRGARRSPSACPSAAARSARGSSRTSTRVIEGKASKDPIMYADGFASCDGLVGWGCKRHCRVSRGENGSVERGNPGDRIDGIEGFWGYAKDRPVKYQGAPEEDLYLHLRECEFGFDMRGRDMYRFMLRELRERPLN